MRIHQASMDLRTLKEFCRRFPCLLLNILRSFGMLDKEMFDLCEKYRHLFVGFILDSGTWTLNNASAEAAKHITLENYGSYAQRVEGYFDYYFNFDSNFTNEGFRQNYANQLWLEKHGLKPVPVVHQIEGNEIETYIRRGYKRVALGSTQITKEETLAKVMERFAGTGIKIHLFGQTNFKFLAHFPIDSCDTAMWTREGGWGKIRYWNESRDGENKTDVIYLEEKMEKKPKRKHNFTTYEFREQLERFLGDTFNITYYDLIGNDGAFYKRLVNTYYFVRLQEEVNRIHKEKGFVTTL